ncbi:hypothetical protein HMPREF0083_01967 [Aneurinibacillus aneurinilyticus ATCC 12856]|uniref:Uncharacterized protein n=1 Tax=Aneurinibacillus aneurinilyticus ATCC 12856 TaxID=649747 RepID=U1WMY8_ANEAE|nr:hypothetical protein HMPREF0083_01967 [Aneurinibacillus aneurinilyticus ATCC 12856]
MYERSEGAEERVWVRNIIWFILLIGIVVFSILLFLLVMDPVPNYNAESEGQTQKVGEQPSETDTGNKAPVKIEGAQGQQTVREAGEQAQHSQASGEGPAQGTPEIPVTESPQGNQTVTTTEKQLPEEKTPPAVQAGGEANKKSIWYGIGQGVGYVAVVVSVIPYLIFSVLGRRGRTAFRQLGHAGTHSLSFLSQLAIAVAALHGGIMLRLIPSWDRHLLGGAWLFVFLVLFFLHASLYKPGAPTRSNSFSILAVVILLLFIIHAIG